MNNIRKNIVKTFVITRKNSVNTDSQYPKLGTHHRIFSTSSIVAAVRDFNEVNRSALAFFLLFNDSQRFLGRPWVGPIELFRKSGRYLVNRGKRMRPRRKEWRADDWIDRKLWNSRVQSMAGIINKAGNRRGGEEKKAEKKENDSKLLIGRGSNGCATTRQLFTNDPRRPKSNNNNNNKKQRERGVEDFEASETQVERFESSIKAPPAAEFRRPLIKAAELGPPPPPSHKSRTHTHTHTQTR